MQSDGSKLILDTELLECAALTGLNNNLCNSTSETTYDGVLLNCEHSSCLLSCLSDDILIDRLDSVDVDEFSIYTVSRKR